MTTVVLRPATTDDFNFIMSSWIQSYREHSNLTFEEYSKFYNHLVRRTVENTMTIVACPSDSQDMIYGWLNFDLFQMKPVIHYAYVKAIYRGMGIGTKLLDSVSKDRNFIYTHKTKSMGAGRYCPHMIYKESQDGQREDGRDPDVAENDSASKL